MTDSDGNLSIDFLVAFTIFMVAFVWVATLVPNLFIGVSTHAIDFDSVAYRTGVILAEDPGVSSNKDLGTRWEYEKDTGKDNIQRFGLALSRDTPNILSEKKVERFFDDAVFTADDYRAKAIFGDYPYHFRINLTETGGDTRSVGEIPPENSGYIRKEVRIKHFGSNATIDRPDIIKFKLNSSDTSKFILDSNRTEHHFVIQINRSKLLYDNITDPVINPNYNVAYRIDPRSDEINITIGGFHDSPPVAPWVNKTGQWATINLACVTLFQTITDENESPTQMPSQLYSDFLYHNMVLQDPPFELAQDDTLTVIFRPGFFSPTYDRGSVFVNFNFTATTTDPLDPMNPPVGLAYLNTTQTRPWELTYNTTETTLPDLTSGVMEVWVW